MWALETREIGAGAIRACLQENGAPATFDRLCNAWRSDASFRLQWVSFLRAIPFEAYAWENPPLTIATKSRAHECVFIDNPALLRMTADPQPFRDELKGKRGAISFPNLGRDALLVGVRDVQHLAGLGDRRAGSRGQRGAGPIVGLRVGQGKSHAGRRLQRLRRQEADRGPAPRRRR